MKRGAAKATGGLPVHTPPAHVPLAQSAATEHILPEAQRGQVPPQSTSVSLPSRAWSKQVLPVGVHWPAMHLPYMQSPSARQPSPKRQVAPQPPPQSTSVSS